MAQQTKDFKIPQDFGMRTRGGVVSQSQKPQRIPVDAAFGRVVTPGVPSRRFAAPLMAVVPTRRVFGLFPMSHGTRRTNKVGISRLADSDLYDESARNDQRQATSIPTVAGLNTQRNATTKARFSGYAGNAADLPSHISKVKHADDASRSSPSKTIGAQQDELASNPITITAVKMAEQNAKLLDKLRRRNA